MKTRVSGLSLRFLSLVVLGLPTLSSSAQESSIVQMCEMAVHAGPEQGNGCECALTIIRNEISGEQFEIYAAVGTLYFENMANGLDQADAWDAAAKSVGAERGMSFVEVLEVTNPIGQLHAQAIKDCGS
jgi:hypothetical protein